MKSSELLLSYLRGLRRHAGAEAVSLYVPPSASGLASALLLHAGGPPLPELADLASASAMSSSAGEDRDPGAGAQPQPSRDADGLVLRLPDLEELVGSSDAAPQRPETPRRRLLDADLERSSAAGAWLGVRWAAGRRPEGLGAEPPATSWGWLLALGGALAWHVRRVSLLLDDPITGLPGRLRLQAELDDAIAEAVDGGSPVALLLVNPDDFDAVNERLGRRLSDAVVAEIALRLRSALRTDDFVARYGGVVFAAVLAGTSRRGVDEVAAKLLETLSGEPYEAGPIHLDFRVGGTLFEPGEGAGEPSSLDLLRRADRALNRARAAESRSAVAEGDPAVDDRRQHVDRLSGIFTGDMSRDYRNMGLLWDTLGLSVRQRDPDVLRRGVAALLLSALKLDRVAIFDPGGDGAEGEVDPPRLAFGLERSGEADHPPSELGELDEAGRRLALAAAEDGRSRSERFAGARRGRRLSRGTRRCALPLGAGDDRLGVLYLEAPEELLSWEKADELFLEALADQLALALDRARLAAAERRRLERQVDELQRAVQESRLIYRSPEMEELLDTARRVAPTDATVLITGESGTGKELLAQTLHELSPRRRRAFTVVDCGAISSTLIDSELFGHERGAYTGAERRRPGRLAEADGGTVLLDEIGELPLEVQSKLLRFVQDRQITPVGGSRPKRVDVRLLAATNRDLAVEVESGRFREDLFHRLNVVSLVVPPLRRRPADVDYLAAHFVRTYAALYRKPVEGLTPAAEAALARHPWPGNVRELRNRVMQAVILCEGARLGAADLGLEEEGRGEVGERRDRPGVGARGTEEREAAGSRSPDEAWSALRRALDDEVRRAVDEGHELASPLGDWLAEDLVLEAHRAADGVGRRAAERLGLAESTFRRRFKAASARAEAGAAPRSASWPRVRRALVELVALGPDEAADDLLAAAERELLRRILHRVPDDVSSGAALLGVSPPTFRRRRDEG